MLTPAEISSANAGSQAAALKANSITQALPKSGPPGTLINTPQGPTTYGQNSGSVPSTVNPGTLGTIPPLTATFTPPKSGPTPAPAVVTADAANDHIDTMTNANNTANTDMQNAAATKANIAATNAQNAAAAASKSPTSTTQSPSGDDPNATLDSLFSNLGEEENPTNTADGMTPEQEQMNANTVADDTNGIIFDEQNLSDVNDALSSMENGTFPLPAAQQAQVDNIRSQFTDAMKAAQDFATNVMGGVAALNAGGEDGGLQEYSPVMAVANIQAAIKSGSATVAKVSSDIVSAQSKLSDALQAKDYTAANRLYTQINDNIKDRSDEIDKINTAVQKGIDTIQTNETAYTKLAIDTYLKQSASDATSQYRAQQLILSSDRLTETERHDYMTELNSQKATGTAAERSANAVSQFSQAFTPGAKMADGTPTVDENGYITPAAWQAAIKDAPAEGLDRADFIKAFGSMIYNASSETKNPGINARAYGLTPAEVKIITGALGT